MTLNPAKPDLRHIAALLVVLVSTLATEAWARPPLWIVRDRDSEIVLFGSVHVLPPRLDWRPPRLDRAIRRADDLWFELQPGPGTENEARQLAQSQSRLPPGQSLSQLLSEAGRSRLAQICQTYHIDPDLLAPLAPWYAEVALGGIQYRASGADLSLGVEGALAAGAPTSVHQRAFETPKEQIDMFANAPMGDQLASLEMSLQDMVENPDAYHDLIDVWMRGDVAALDREALAPLRTALPGLYGRLVSARNAAWTRTLDARLKGHGHTVVIVGIGHLIGPDGVPARLRALGYSVEGP